MSNTDNCNDPSNRYLAGSTDPALDVDFRGVFLSYDKFAVLKGIDLQVKNGERVAIIGPSGSGKTTLIRCVTGLEVPQAGSVRVFGKDLRSKRSVLNMVRRDIGMLFQRFNLYSNKTVLRNVSLAPIRVLGMTRVAAESRAMAELERVGMTEYADRYPFEISGGQQQRVAVARELAMKPKLFLLDEPTSALDPELVSSVGRMFNNIAAEEGMTVVCVTHDLGFARSVGDRLIFMAEGDIVADGTPESVLSNSSNARVRAFMNSVKR